MSFNLEIERINKFLEGSKNIVVFTGAGVSTNSGIMDFKSLDNSSEINREIVLNINYFKREPEMFWKNFERIFDFNALSSKVPNSVHKYIADLEKTYEVTVVTQNIDKLHQKAGSTNVLELHGTSDNFICLSCKKNYSLASVNEQLKYKESIDIVGEPPKCSCGEFLKPDVVLYGEPIKYAEEADMAFKQADTLLILGTRLEVFPANSFVESYLKRKRKKERYTKEKYKSLIYNADSTVYNEYIDLVIKANF